ncbi:MULTISPECIES: L,D-transpeptidase [Lactobacillus]|uniref:Murein L,D-transpeptidase n=1 Tax=Lactobacillus xujianguonis TaxID=2495899 RepID=A0A437SUI9_9LACO|nr:MULTISPECIES: L,D-transpeptidase [Lactobacillus]RVU70596.1 murein L,D-transpeptidase [Lactobacillus xujianguonis]RVU73779.1 murein L,D-transpeptidase [Lactobacillus xujianguonis]
MKKKIPVILTVIAFILILVGLAKMCNPTTSHQDQAQETKVKPKKKHLSVAEAARPYPDPKDLRPAGSWNKTSEKKKYPKLGKAKDLVLRVSLKGNRVYVIKRGHVVYTMLASGGVYKNGKSDTPTGTFEIKEGRGDSFFNQGLNEGANNWVSWDPDDANVYLFHSVPTKADGTYNMKEAKKLGKTQGSHGCIRLSVPDSRWLMENVPVGTKVIIEDE